MHKHVTPIDWKHEARVTAEDGHYRAAIYCLSEQEPHLAGQLAAISQAEPDDRQAYYQAMSLVLGARSSVTPRPHV